MPEVSPVSSITAERPVLGNVESLKGLGREDCLRLSLTLTAKLAKAGGALRNNDHVSEDEQYLEARLAEQGREVDVNDPDDLWKAVHIVYPPKEADLAYHTIRAVEHELLDEPIPESWDGWNAKRIHQELLQQPTELEKLNDRQLIGGEFASLKLFNQAVKELRAKKAASGTSRRRLFKAAASAGIGLLGLATIGAGTTVAVTEIGRRAKVEPPSFKPKTVVTRRQIITATPVPTKVPTQEAKPTQTAIPTETPPPTSAPQPPETPTPTPTENPTISAEREVGEMNVAEFFIGGLLDAYVEVRQMRANDPAFLERVGQEIKDKNNWKNGWIHIVYQGLDTTRERWREFDRNGIGRADVFKSFFINPAAMQIVVVTYQRDLFVPEQIPYKFSGEARINTVPMIPYVMREKGSLEETKTLAFEQTRKIIETATGMPVDMLFQNNIDFLQGQIDWTDPKTNQFEAGLGGIIDLMLPEEGIDIEVKETIIDPAYPAMHYGTEGLVIKPGQKKWGGREATKFARSRHTGESDFGRSRRQDMVFKAFVSALVPYFADDFLRGNTNTIDLLIESLEKQQDANNFFSYTDESMGEVDFVKIVSIVRDKVAELRSTPKGLAILSALMRNSADKFDKLRRGENIKTFSPQKGAELADIDRRSKHFYQFVLQLMHPADRNPVPVTDRPPTKLGNYMEYWQPFRDKVQTLLQSVS